MQLSITIPESLDYTEVFDDIFKEYTTHAELTEVKTASLGSLYKLHYRVRLADCLLYTSSPPTLPPLEKYTKNFFSFFCFYS